MTDSLWSLPGPARFAAAARGRLDRGASVLVVLPGYAAGDDTFHRGLLDAIDYGTDPIDGCAMPDRPVPSVIAELLGVDDIMPGPGAAAALARHGMMHGRALTVSVSGKPGEMARWTAFLPAFLAAARTVEVAARPRLIVIGGQACAAALSGAELLEPMWWWGVFDRLDTASLVRRELFSLAGRDGDDLLRDTVTEVAGFDLDLAEYLAAAWDGDHATLAGVLASYPGPDWPRAAVPDPLPGSSTRLGPPPAAMLPLWDLGLADAWDTFPVYLHACSVSGEVLRSRIWRAQVRCLMPQIDEERARIAAWLRREVRSLTDDEILEPGDLYEVMQVNPALKTWRGGHRYRLVSWLRGARNRLAHLSVLTPEEIASGNRLIQQDRNRE